MSDHVHFLTENGELLARTQVLEKNLTQTNLCEISERENPLSGCQLKSTQKILKLTTNTETQHVKEISTKKKCNAFSRKETFLRLLI